MTVRLLCVGDIHLGRRPGHLPGAVRGRLSAAELSPSAAWRRTVRHALDEGVDAVLLAGDVVEQRDDFFEAFGELERGVSSLADAGIAVLGVAGNHDVEVLPRLADAIPRFRLLGRGGVWESASVAGRGGAAATVLGWSFPAAEMRESPLRAAGASIVTAMRTGDRPIVGLLHCDLDRRESRHAPVSRAELSAAAVDAWLLGHVHRPDPLDGARPVGYLGSLVGLDPTETGAHGAWLVEAHHRGLVTARQVPLAPLRWESFDVSVDGLASPADVGERIGRAVRAMCTRISVAGSTAASGPVAVGCRVRLVGRHADRRGLEQSLARDDPRELVVERDDVVCFVSRCEVAVAPAVSLEKLALGVDPPALLARKLLVLRREPGDPERERLLAAARLRLVAVSERPELASLAPSASGAPALLEAAALRALDRLLAQREVAR